MKEPFDTTQCEGCHYWRNMSGLDVNACHYRIDHHTGAQKVDGTCLSRKEREQWRGKEITIGKTIHNEADSYVREKHKELKRRQQRKRR